MKRKPAGVVRIIAGRWRGTRLSVPDLPGLRPSGDRSRETLFNWLQADLRGARCADLFAGSGALGLEAASRGAAEVTLIEQSPQAMREIRATVERLGAETVHCVQGDALDWLDRARAGSLDIVFIDPPFGSGLDAKAFRRVDEKGLVAPGGLVYVEGPRDADPVTPGTAWTTHRDKVLGEVHMRLFKKIKNS